MKRIKKYFTDLNNSYQTFKVESKQELEETKQLAKLIWQFRDRRLTPEEIQLVKEQSVDLFKVVVTGGIFLIPGGTFIIFFLVKKGKHFGIKVLPSSFNKEK
jgi:hypothetical protein